MDREFGGRASRLAVLFYSNWLQTTNKKRTEISRQRSVRIVQRIKDKIRVEGRGHKRE
jgi:hypothetical protein